MIYLQAVADECGARRVQSFEYLYRKETRISFSRLSTGHSAEKSYRLLGDKLDIAIHLEGTRNSPAKCQLIYGIFVKDWIPSSAPNSHKLQS